MNFISEYKIVYVISLWCFLKSFTVVQLKVQLTEVQGFFIIDYPSGFLLMITLAAFYNIYLCQRY